MKKVGKTKEVQSIMDSLRRIVRALRKSSRKTENQLGLRTAQTFVLQQLITHEPLSLNELSEKTYSHQSTVSVVVNSLVKGGYVRRKERHDDRRFLVLESTPKAKAIFNKKVQPIQEHFTNVIQNMKIKDSTELARLLELFVSEASLASETPHFFFEEEPKKPKL
jgi:DNA-binding MarR family transcriptional regulator